MTHYDDDYVDSYIKQEKEERASLKPLPEVFTDQDGKLITLAQFESTEAKQQDRLKTEIAVLSKQQEGVLHQLDKISSVLHNAKQSSSTSIKVLMRLAAYKAELKRQYKTLYYNIKNAETVLLRTAATFNKK